MQKSGATSVFTAVSASSPWNRLAETLIPPATGGLTTMRRSAPLFRPGPYAVRGRNDGLALLIDPAIMEVVRGSGLISDRALPEIVQLNRDG